MNRKRKIQIYLYMPLLIPVNMITRFYNCYHLSFLFAMLHRGLFIIDDKGILRQITMNDLPVSFCNRPECILPFVRKL